VPNRGASTGSQGAYGGQLQPASALLGLGAFGSTSFLNTVCPRFGRISVMVGRRNADQEGP
jgi:hypothetical protein